jgi:GGDEF domain-containing protein
MGHPADPGARSRRASDAPPDAPPAARLERAARGAEELCGALWETLHDELREPRAQQVVDLAERLALVCSAVADVARRSVPLEPSHVLLPPEEPEIAIHDTRGEGAASWAQAIDASLGRYVRDGLPFAVLLVETLDVERLAQAESPPEIARLLGLIEDALARERRPSDGLTRESRGRWWLTAPQVDARGARALAQRLARAARSAADHRGVPLGVAIGIALCPEDGRDAATLAAHADVGLYAARAAGQSLPPGDAAY